MTSGKVIAKVAFLMIAAYCAGCALGWLIVTIANHL
jgi:hypothetical protein